MRPTRRSWAGPGARPCAAGGRTERSPELGAPTLPRAFPLVSSLLSSGGGAGQRHRGPLTPPVDGVGLGVLLVPRGLAVCTGIPARLEADAGIVRCQGSG